MNVTRGRQPIFTAPGKATGLGAGQTPTAYGQPAVRANSTTRAQTRTVLPRLG